MRLLEWDGLFTEHRELIEEAFRRHRGADVVIVVGALRGFPIAQAWIDFVRASPAALVWAVRVAPGCAASGSAPR